MCWSLVQQVGHLLCTVPTRFYPQHPIGSPLPIRSDSPATWLAKGFTDGVTGTGETRSSILYKFTCPLNTTPKFLWLSMC